MVTEITPAIDWEGWLARWDALQNGYFPQRENRFTALVNAVAVCAGATPRILDLGAGPGTLSLRVLNRLPGARVVAIDNDPVLIEVGRQVLGRHGERVRWLDADLSDPAWASQLPDGSEFDVAVSSTALRWLDCEDLSPLYQTLAALLRPGGVFLDADHIAYGPDQARIALLATGIRTAELLPVQHHVDDWSSWWSAIEGERGLTDAFADRRRRGHDHPSHATASSYEFHREALLEAGFSEVGTLWQRLSDRVLVAIR
jgi:SAM-dependent methyltransferase